MAIRMFRMLKNEHGASVAQGNLCWAQALAQALSSKLITAYLQSCSNHAVIAASRNGCSCLARSLCISCKLRFQLPMWSHLCLSSAKPLRFAVRRLTARSFQAGLALRKKRARLAQAVRKVAPPLQGHPPIRSCSQQCNIYTMTYTMIRKS